MSGEYVPGEKKEKRKKKKEKGARLCFPGVPREERILLQRCGEDKEWENEPWKPLSLLAFLVCKGRGTGG